MDSDIEQDGKKKRELLYGFFTTCDDPLSEEEEISLNPILNALNHTKARYDAPTLIAEGGEKRIYKVYDQHLNRFVAMAQSAKAQTPNEQEQFLREGQLTANLNHPNIVPIHNMGLDSGGVPFFSMELVPGDSLKDIFKKLKAGDPPYEAQYTLEILLGIFNKMCDAVAYAHSRSVLHLDIKPDNIRVGQFGEVLLCDWGLARILDQDRSGEAERGQLDANMLNDMTLTGTVKGTPGFMAPEQVNNQKKTGLTDLYALGSLLYFILTNELPVEGESANEIVENTRKGNIIHPRKYRPKRSVPTGLAAVAMKALAFDPLDRYSSVQHLQADVNRFLASYPTLAEQAGPFTRMALLTQRHRKLTLWIVTFLTLLAVVMSVGLAIIHREKKEAVEARREADRLNLALTGVYESTSENSDNLYPSQKLKILERLDLQAMGRPDVQKIVQRKAELQFVLQNFNEAHRNLLQVDDNKEALLLRELALKYGTLKPDDSATLRHGELADLIATPGVPGRLSYAMYHEHIAVEFLIETPESYLPLAHILLGKVNGILARSRRPLKLIQREKGYYLDLSGTHYSIYTFPVFGNYSHHILSPLQLVGMDISNTPVSLLDQIKDLKINELRMVGVQLEPQANLRNVFRQMGLERVIFGKDNYPEWIVRGLREDGVEVVEEEYER